VGGTRRQGEKKGRVMVALDISELTETYTTERNNDKTTRQLEHIYCIISILVCQISGCVERWFSTSGTFGLRTAVI
jgi:hypothetical protein